MLDKLVAIDVHTHAERNADQPPDPVTARAPGSGRQVLRRRSAAAHRGGGRRLLPRAQHGRGRSSPSTTRPAWGVSRLGNDEVFRAARENPDVLIPFASVDPHKGKLGVREARELIDAGARGFKFHPNTQAFCPNDRTFYPLYEVIAEAGLVALFHSGTTGIGAGMPGGGGIRLKYSQPMLVDDVAADFPELNIILAHPSFPWQEEALAIAVHKPNVYIDSQRLVAQVLPGDPDPLHEHAAQAQDAVRLGLPDDHARPLALGLREAADQGRGPTAGAQGKRDQASEARLAPREADRWRQKESRR